MIYLHNLLCEKREELISAFNDIEVDISSEGGAGRVFPFEPTRDEALTEWCEASETLNILLKDPTGGAKVPPEAVRSAAISVAAPHILKAALHSTVGSLREKGVEPVDRMVDIIAIAAQVIELGNAVYLSHGEERDAQRSETLDLE